MEIGQNYTQALKGYQKELADYQLTASADSTLKQKEPSQSFDSMFNSAISALDATSAKASQNTTDLITGDLDNIHSLMIDMSEAQLTLQTAVQVRNKCIEAYNEIKNMQF